MLAVTIPVILLLLAVNALYVAAEFAAVSVRKSRLRQMATDGHRLATYMRPIVEDRAQLDRYIAACQVGITFSSLILGAFGQATLTPYIAPAVEELAGMGEGAAFSVTSVGVLLGLTATQVVLAELVPKSVALQFPTQVSIYTVLPMRWSLSALRWFIAILNGSALALLRMIGAPETSHGHIHSPGEIELLIAQTAEGGELTTVQRLRLRRALHLGSRSAHEVMVPRPRISALNVHANLPDAIDTVAAAPYTRMPVYDDTIDNIVGILHTKDLVLNSLSEQPASALGELLRPAPVLPESITVDRLLGVLRDEAAPMAILADEYGGVAGLVTMEDILAEIMGTLGDEFKAGEPEPARLEDGRMRIPGMMPLEEASAILGASWEGSSATVGGHVTDALGHVPAAGEHVTIDGVQVEVEQVERRAVMSLLVTMPPVKVPEDE